MDSFIESGQTHVTVGNLTWMSSILNGCYLMGGEFFEDVNNGEMRLFKMLKTGINFRPLRIRLGQQIRLPCGGHNGRYHGRHWFCVFIFNLSRGAQLVWAIYFLRDYWRTGLQSSLCPLCYRCWILFREIPCIGHWHSNLWLWSGYLCLRPTHLLPHNENGLETHLGGPRWFHPCLLHLWCDVPTREAESCRQG